MLKGPRDIGLGTSPPPQTCTDDLCPYHGKLAVRGKVLEGIVVSDRMQRTVTVQREYLHFQTKYKRYEKRRSKIQAHSPPCINASRGDRVKVAECRPLSKTVAFVVIQKLDEEITNE
jgi:small subunit ribosomal protein S17